MRSLNISTLSISNNFLILKFKRKRNKSERERENIRTILSHDHLSPKIGNIYHVYIIFYITFNVMCQNTLAANFLSNIKIALAQQSVRVFYLGPKIRRELRAEINRI